MKKNFAFALHSVICSVFYFCCISYISAHTHTQSLETLPIWFSNSFFFFHFSSFFTFIYCQLTGWRTVNANMFWAVWFDWNNTYCRDGAISHSLFPFRHFFRIFVCAKFSPASIHLENRGCKCVKNVCVCVCATKEYE